MLVLGECQTQTHKIFHTSSIKSVGTTKIEVAEFQP